MSTYSVCFTNMLSLNNAVYWNVGWKVTLCCKVSPQLPLLALQCLFVEFPRDDSMCDILWQCVREPGRALPKPSLGLVQCFRGPRWEFQRLCQESPQGMVGVHQCPTFHAGSCTQRLQQLEIILSLSKGYQCSTEPESVRQSCHFKPSATCCFLFKC